MRVVNGALICCWLASVAPGRAQDPTDIAQRLYLAKFNFERDKAELKRAVDEHFRKLEANLPKDSFSHPRALEQINVQRAAYRWNCELPPLPAAVLKTAAVASDKMRAAYDDAIKEYTLAEKLDEAAALQKELKSFKKIAALPDLPAPYKGRRGSVRAERVAWGGGNVAGEMAVYRALAWLAKQQNRYGGFWEFDGAHKNDRVAATGMCLLPFMAAGQTHTEATKYKEVVRKGLNYLTGRVKPNGNFGSLNMYSHAIATTAVCEAAGMTGDEKVIDVARLAVDYIVKAQASDGSWGYTSETMGDTSIVGWQMQALQSARLAGIPVPTKTLERAGAFLDSVAENQGATYGYRTRGASHTLTAVGLHCRRCLGWKARHSAMIRGVDYLWTKFPPKANDWNVYYYYYAAQDVHFVGGQVWQRDWNPAMLKILLEKQTTPTTRGADEADIGSFPPDIGSIGNSCGKLGTTALACLTLEVYYRHSRGQPVWDKDIELKKDAAPAK